MTQDDADETITRIAAALRPLPDVDPAQKARVLVAVAAERERDRRRRIGTVRRWRVAGIAAAGMLAASAFFALFTRGGSIGAPSKRAAPASAGADRNVSTRSVAITPPRSPAITEGQVTQAARDADAVAMEPVQLVFRAPSAHRVSIVGDFNDWDAQRTAMTRDASTGLWSQTVLLRPGRHVYAFFVDDSVWMRDPRSPAANDADFGRPGSVLLVGKP
jgi:hypothetical protein